MERTVFQHCALVSSLLTQADLDAALSALGGSRVMSSKSISDEALAAKLIDMGRLNRWQAEQLRNGRTKFTLGQYQVIDSIARGGMGEVFKGEHKIMGRIVAVKVLPLERSTPQAIASFMHEIRAQGQLEHENLVRAYDAGHDGNVHYFVTEYVPGTDLRRLIRAQGKMTMQVAASVIIQAAKGLDHAHSKGLIHRDVKPGNLLVTPDGRTKVSDLGLAGWFGDNDQIGIHGGKVVGTADYLAPEQIMAPEKLGPVSDVYSLGCTLYYAATCKVPFPGGSSKDKAKAHCSQPPLDPRRLNPELSDEFTELIADMMAKQPEQRIQTMGEVVERLTPWMEGAVPRAPHEPARNVTPPPIRFIPGVRVPPSPLSDTEPYFLARTAEEPGSSESPSQASFGSQSTHAGFEETSPNVVPRRPILASNSNPLPHATALPAYRFPWSQTPLIALGTLVVGLLVGLAIGYFAFRL
ncbi:MAG: protein kinase [Planctomycetaceae bacterium]|nr:protein kinase [Planctomycetaceae bacterium]